MENDIIELIRTNNELGEKWSLEDWQSFILDAIQHVYQKKDFHPMVIDQILCKNIPRLNKGRYIFDCSLKRDRTQLEKLKQIPKGNAQNSLFWHLKRHNHINASEASEVLGNSYKSILKKKVMPYVHRSSGGLASELGHRYEPISVLINELKTNKKIHDFESIEHPVHTFLAASPDGIDDDGIMKEIKNPRVREIIGVPKPEYWVQTQIQMACCDLNACDFIESYITEYACKEYYGEDTTTEYKGCIIEYWDTNEKCHRFYSDPNISLEQIKKWKKPILDEIRQKNITRDDIIINEVYWKLEKYSCFRVYRDRCWFNSVLPKFKQFWDEVENYRVNGIPDNLVIKKRVIKEENNTNKNEPVKCLIDDNSDY
jgi:hypothetical protein